ncbi:MAG: hypothetical protein B5M54_04815 [Candidatus Aminicenantes bacterium 4484_214]|nr:MAG: hypothetical protein B5M54_04815 [Candidatus Aminicenantes bacterium 4484_214]
MFDFVGFFLYNNSSDSTMKISFLGTGGAVASQERDNISFLIEESAVLSLIDCPGAVVQKIKKVSYRPQDLKFIFITHIHPDHIYGLPSLIHSLMLEEMNLLLFGSAETIGFCAQLLDLFGLRESKIKCRVELRELAPENEISLTSQLKVTGLAIKHHSSSLGFLWENASGKKIVYSGDTPADRSFFSKIEGVDCLIHDCSAPARFFQLFPELKRMHTDSLTLGKLAEEFRIKRLIPCHFFGEIDFDQEEIVQEIKFSYQGELTVPQDFMSISI